MFGVGYTVAFVYIMHVIDIGILYPSYLRCKTLMIFMQEFIYLFWCAEFT